jgi:hypothetical protein
MNDAKQVNGASRFVGLKVSDEVPAHLFASYFGDFAVRFLDAILTKIDGAELHQLFNRRRRMGLADGYQPDLGGLAAAPLRGGAHARANVRKSYCQWFLRRINVSHEIEIDTES